jgi:hypothetical protein
VSNTITNVTPKLLAQGLLALRERAIFPRIVNTDYSNLASQKGNVINIPLSASITARAITPSITMNSNVDTAPSTVAVTMDYWYEAPFNMSDTDVLSTQAGYIPMNASEAIKALANTIDDYIWGKHTGIFSASGTAGTTPFATNLGVAGDARAALNKQLAPPDDWRGVLDPSAEANLLTVQDILNFDRTGQQGAIIQGAIGRKLGVDWYMDQNLSTFSAGTSWVTGWAVAGTGTTGASTLTIVNSSQTVMGTILVGDIFDLASNSYAITSALSTSSVTDGAVLVFYPPLKAAVASDAAITVAGYGTSYTVNLMFHRDAFCWASRPLGNIGGVGNLVQSEVDPVSGISLRLELSRQYKQTTYSYDVLGGAKLVRPEFATKIMG